MFHGRDVALYEALSRADRRAHRRVDGPGPGGAARRLLPHPADQPADPWPAEKFADLFTREVTEGMVVPRVERRGAAGLVATAATRDGMTATDESLFRGCGPRRPRHRRRRSRSASAPTRCTTSRSSWTRGCPPTASPSAASTAGRGRRRDAGRGRRARRLRRARPRRRRGRAHVTDTERVALVAELIEAGHADRILLSSNATGVARAARPRRALQPRAATFVPRWGRGRQRRRSRSASSSPTRATCSP